MAWSDIRGTRALKKLDLQIESAKRAGAWSEVDQLLAQAGDILVKFNRPQDAIELYMREGNLPAAAGIAERHKLWSKAAKLWLSAKDLRRAAQAYEQDGQHLAAAEIYEQAGDLAKSVELRESANDLVHAAAICAKLGDNARAAKLIVRALKGQGRRRIVGQEASELCRRASALFAAAGDLDRAVAILKMGGEHGAAAQLLARVGRPREAIAMFEAAGDLKAAAEAARAVGDESEAFALMARQAMTEGRVLDAAAHYAQAGKHLDAARLFEYAQEPLRAAAEYEAGGLPGAAAQIYQDAGRLEDAARCFKVGGNEAEAKNVLRRSRQVERTEAGEVTRPDALSAAYALLDEARNEDPAKYQAVLKVLGTVPPTHEDFVRSRRLIASVYVELGDRQSAISVLDALISGSSPTASDVGCLYQKAKLLEMDGQIAAAAVAYEAVAKIDPDYLDVGQRLEATKLRDGTIRRQATSPLSGVITPRSAPIAPASGQVSRGSSSATSRATSSASAAAQSGPGGPVLSRPEPLQRVSSAGVTPVAAPLSISSTGSSPALPAGRLVDPQRRGRSIDGDTTTALVSPRPQLGAILRGRFRVEELLGEGSQAAVYLARDVVLDRLIAIKIFNHEGYVDEARLEGFLSEARLAAKVRHPGCLTVYDFGEESGMIFVAMEYFQGRTVKDRLLDGALAVDEALRVGKEISLALSAVHKAGIVHRDIKPSNIMIDDVGEVRLADFGVAARMGEAAPEPGVLVGTLKYMAPEQGAGLEIDHRADIFALGVVLYEMLSGAAPFEATLQSVIRRMSTPAPPLPETQEISEVVRAIVRRCLQTDPTARYPQVLDLAKDLERAMSG